VVGRAAVTSATRGQRVGWYLYDWANSAFVTTVVTVFLGPYLTAVAKVAAGCEASDPCRQGVIRPLGVPIAPGALFAYAVSASVVLTVVVLPVVGAVADRSPSKRRLLVGFAYLGSAATIGLVAVTGGRYALGAGLFIVANVAFGASVVVYNSFLPELAGPDERDRVSSVGWAIGYLGGGLLLAGNVAAVLVKDSMGWSTGEVARYCIGSAGVWWAGFTTVSGFWLPDRAPAAGVGEGFLDSLTGGFRQLGRTLRQLRAYPLTLLFLLAFLVYNDGVQTVIALAGTYGVEELGLPDTVLVPTILMVQMLAFVGALTLGWAARVVGAWKTLLGGLVGWVVVVAGAVALPAGRVAPFVGLAAGIGLVLGGVQALSRSLFSHLIPKGREGEYFGLYEISDKGTSWLGPLLFGITFDLTRSYRAAIVSLLGFFVVGFVALAAVPVRRAILAAGNQPPRVL
jgi:UMF1 family MFS transporter